MELYKNAPHYKILRALDISYPSNSSNREREIKEIIPDFDGFNSLDESSEELLEEYKENSDYKKLVMKFMKDEKNPLFSRILAEELDPSEIPPKFNEAFQNAIKLTEENYE